jgi:hypothetical protein
MSRMFLGGAASVLLRRSTHGRGVLTKLGTRYKAFPAILVFPNLLLVACKIFVTGLVKRATALALDTRANGTCAFTTCRMVTVGSLAGALLYTFWGWFVILDFSCRFRSSSWKAAEPPETADETKDPIFRLLNRVRSRFVRQRTRALTDRARGKLTKPEEEMKEPQRTERLLRRVCRLRHRNLADTLDAYQFAFFPRSGGARASHLFFDHGGMTVQLVIAVLSGVGTHLEKGTVAAALTVASTCALQLLGALYCLVCWPSSDKGDACMVGLQVLTESVRTGLLLLQLPIPHAAISLREVSFVLSLVAIGVPMFRFFYDGFVVPVVTLHRGDKLNRRAIAVGLLMFVINAKKFVLKLLAVEAGDVSTAANGAENTGKMAKTTFEQGISVDVDTAFGDGEVMRSAMDGWDEDEDRAAKTIQRCYRVSRHRLQTRRADESKRATHDDEKASAGRGSRSDLEWLIRAETRAARARAMGV